MLASIFGSSFGHAIVVNAGGYPKWEFFFVGEIWVNHVFRGSLENCVCRRTTLYPDGGVLLEYLRATREEGTRQQRIRDDQEMNHRRELRGRDAEYQMRQERLDDAQRKLFEANFLQQAETNHQFQQMVMATRQRYRWRTLLRKTQKYCCRTPRPLTVVK